MADEPTNVRAFICELPGRANQLVSWIRVKSALPGGNWREYDAIWDTGSMISSISTKVSQECGLQTTGFVNTVGPTGAKRAREFQVTFMLPNKVQFPVVKVIGA